MLKNKKFSYKMAIVASIFYLIFSCSYIYEKSFDNYFFYPNINFFEILFSLISSIGYILLLPIPNNITENIFNLSINESITILSIMVNLIIIFTFFGLYSIKINYKIFTVLMIIIFFIFYTRCCLVFNKGSDILLTKTQKTSLLKNSNNFKVSKNYYNNKNFNDIDLMFMQENNHGYGTENQNLYINIIENGFYDKQPISVEQQYYRAYYYLINNSAKYYNGIDVPYNVYSLTFINKYCAISIFNVRKNNFCKFYRNKIHFINLKEINNQDINNFEDIAKLSLLGNTNASKEILNHYGKNTKDYAFWLMIGAENGDKTIQREFGEFLKSDAITDDQLKVVFLTRDEKDIRGDFWIKRSQEN